MNKFESLDFLAPAADTYYIRVSRKAGQGRYRIELSFHKQDSAISDRSNYDANTGDNEFDIELDKLCTSTIAQFQPKARELRTVLMILKMTADLERMADHAVNIAESAENLYHIEKRCDLLAIPDMAGLCKKILHDALSASSMSCACVGEPLPRTRRFPSTWRRSPASASRGRTSSRSSRSGPGSSS